MAINYEGTDTCEHRGAAVVKSCGAVWHIHDDFEDIGDPEILHRLVEAFHAEKESRAGHLKNKVCRSIKQIELSDWKTNLTVTFVVCPHSGVLLGGLRDKAIPLTSEAFDDACLLKDLWQDGVYGTGFEVAIERFVPD